MLNQPDPINPLTLGPVSGRADLVVNDDPITEMEVAAAIKSMKSNKAAGLDEINAELLKQGGQHLVYELTQLINRCWLEQKVPQSWQDGVIVRLPKKGDLSNCNNWRGITLLSVPGKVFCAVLLSRLRTTVDALLREEQAGFRTHRSCT
jgi:hypothetical protein